MRIQQIPFLLALASGIMSCSGEKEVIRKNSIFSQVDSTQAESITNIEISKSAYDSIPSDIVRLKNLESLEVEGYRLAGQEGKIKGLHKLNSLTIKRDSSADFPSSFINGLQLSSIRVIESNYHSLPESISKQTELSRLTFNDGELIDASEVLCKLTKLKELDLSKNKLIHMPECVFEMPSLKQLFLNFNKISVFNLKANNSNINILSISGNPVQSLPDKLFENLNLNTFSADSCQLNKLPESIAKATHLSDLSISRNGLTDLPNSFEKLRLESLNIASNKFTELPEVVYKMESIRKLYIYRNNFKFYPEKLANKSALNILSVSPDQISHLDRNSFKGFKGLVLLIDLPSDASDIQSFKDRFETQDVSVLRLIELK